MRNIFRKNKIVELTNTEKVQQSKEQIETSLGMFTKVYGDLEQANTTLQTVIEEDSNLIEETQSNIKTAQTELEGNKALQDKIKMFIKKEQ